jgi:hypothetical protein
LSLGIVGIVIGLGLGLAELSAVLASNLVLILPVTDLASFLAPGLVGFNEFLASILLTTGFST